MNLFKKIFNQTQEGLMLKTVLNETEKQSSSYPREVLEIHNEFSIAADKLLSEANSVLKEAASKNVTKVNRLQSLGFKQVKEVEELTPLLQKTELSKEQIELLNYFKLHYPNYKFITEEQVKFICHKYNLVCGEVGRFKGFVPDKNLKEIENFQLKNADTIDNIVVFIEETGRIENLDWGKVTNKKEVEYLVNVYLSVRVYSYISSPNSPYSTYPTFTKLVNRTLHQDKDFKQQEAQQFGLQICAPVKDMDISGLELIEGYKLKKKHIPDPIVLQPVKGGYLILTMWADETFDPFTEPILRNDTFNN